MGGNKHVLLISQSKLLPLERFIIWTNIYHTSISSPRQNDIQKKLQHSSHILFYSVPLKLQNVDLLHKMKEFFKKLSI